MSFEIVPAYEISLTEQARVANESFAGYVGGWHDLDPGSLARFLLLQGGDLFYSRFIRCDDRLAGFGYINRTGDVLRLSGMGLAAFARGTGAAGHLLEHLLDEARQRRDRMMTLEVIQQNPRAVALYRKHGFEEIGGLFGWRHRTSGGTGTMTEIDILEVLEMKTARDYPDIPWQISRHAIGKVERTRAYAAGDCCVIIGDPAADPIRLHGVFAATKQWSELRELLAAVMNAHAEREFFAPAIWPEDYGREVFEPLGFKREPLSQFFMRFNLVAENTPATSTAAPS